MSKILALIFIVSFSAAASAQTLNIFGNAVPNYPIDVADAITLGTKFWSTVPGTVSGIRFYRAAANPAGYTARLYAADGTMLGSATIAQESAPIPGWQEAIFASPIPISANTTYVAAYYSSGGHGPWDINGLRNGVENGPLIAPASNVIGGNGVYNYGNTFPTRVYSADNYYVDVTFTPSSASALLSLDLLPPNPIVANNAVPGTEVAKIIVKWSDGSPFIGTLGFSQPYSNDGGRFAISGSSLVVNPVGPGLTDVAGTVRHVTVTANQDTPTPPPPPPPGSDVLIAPSNGTLTTAAGAWTFGIEWVTGQYQILLNGSYTGGYASKMAASFGQLFVYNSSRDAWWVWDGRWVPSYGP